MGAAEFAVVLPETDEHTGFLLAEQILARLRRTYRERASRSSRPASASPPTRSTRRRAEELIAAGDSAATVGESLGSDRAVVYSADVEGAIARRGRRARRARAAPT